MDTFVEILRAGVDGLIEYLSAHVITCLVPALFIGGAIAAFLSQAAVLKYFGPKANKVLSYGVASVSGDHPGGMLLHRTAPLRGDL